MEKGVCLSVSPVSLSICLSVSLSVRLSVYRDSFSHITTITSKCDEGADRRHGHLSGPMLLSLWCMCVAVAHRIETILHCDRILLLDK